MASTSGTSTFNYTRDQIINSAARKLGAIAAGEALSAGALEDFADALNIMVKGWDASGLHIWTETEGTLFLEPNQISYIIGGNTTDNACTTYTATTIQTGALNGAMTISVASIAGINNGDNIGIVLDSGLIQWTTVNGTPSGNSVSLTTGLTDTAAVGNPVYDYEPVDQVLRPLRVVGARRLAFSGLIETPMILLSRLDYRALPNKTTPGTPTQLFYDPRGGANSQGIIYVWPAPVDTTSAINFTWLRVIQDFDNPGDIPDLPTEWLAALIWNLAMEMAPEFDTPLAKLQMIEKRATQWLEVAMGWDREAESYLFGFNTDQTGP